MATEAEGLDLEPPRSLYVHVPLCAAKCAYCDFFSVPTASVSESFALRLVDATLARAESLAERFGAEGFATVYIGGGTPTALGEGAFERLVGGVARLAGGPLEWTVEANPESLDSAHVETLLRHGATRVSVGAQSRDEEGLSILGRPHDWDDALRAAALVASSGLALSADLIAGVPSRAGRGRSPGRRVGRASIALAARELVDAGARHISAYDLVLEEGTPLADARDLSFPDEDAVWEDRIELESALADAGFRRYEVSNYAPPGLECLHNVAYWRLDSYIGAGPGAVSTLVARASGGARPGLDGSSLRIEEARGLPSYESAEEEAAESVVPPREAAFETMMMAFRTRFGLDLERFESRFGIDARSLVGRTLGAWGRSLHTGDPWPGEEESSGPALDGRGLDLLNRFLGDCLSELESTFPVLPRSG